MATLQDQTTSHEAALLARIAELEAKLARAKDRKLTMKVSDKGALSVYGLGRFPVTLYQGQWTKLLAAKGEIEDFILDNQDKLATKE